MGAAKHEMKPLHPAITAALLAVVGLVLLLFPAALYANVMAMIDGHQASHGEAGAPGTATVESAVDARREQICTGTFTPDDGGPAAKVRIEVPGRCKVGQATEARLMRGRPSLFIGYDKPRAWATGAKGWAVYTPLVVLFGLLSLPVVLVIVTLIAKLAKRILRPPEGSKT